MRISRMLSLVFLAAAMSLLATACPKPGGGGATGGTDKTVSTTGGDAAPSAPAGTAPADKPVDDGGLEFSFKTFDGVEHKLSDYRGKPVVVNFFGVT